MLIKFEYIETRDEVIPLGLYSATGYDGFIEAYTAACSLSAKVHIKYIDCSLKQVVQVIPKNYDELWTAGKGSYKLQKPGVMAKDGELIIYAPHIKVFHSNKSINSDIIKAGYHCKDYIKNYIDKNTDFCRNSAAHLTNVSGPGEYNKSRNFEKLQFKVTLATGIPEDICKKVNLGYLDPNTLKKSDFEGKEKLWIEDGGKYLYEFQKIR